LTLTLELPNDWYVLVGFSWADEDRDLASGSCFDFRLGKQAANMNDLH
jgi:hypothetical protein